MSDGYQVLSLDDLDAAAVDRRHADPAPAAPHARLPPVRRQRVARGEGRRRRDRAASRTGRRRGALCGRARARHVHARRRDVRCADGNARARAAGHAARGDRGRGRHDRAGRRCQARRGVGAGALGGLLRRVRPSCRRQGRRGARARCRHACAPSRNVAGRVQRSLLRGAGRRRRCRVRAAPRGARARAGRDREYAPGDGDLTRLHADPRWRS